MFTQHTVSANMNKIEYNCKDYEHNTIIESTIQIQGEHHPRHTTHAFTHKATHTQITFASDIIFESHLEYEWDK